VLPEGTLQHPRGGKLADNVVHFARVLRKAGLPVGTDRAVLALQALELAGVAGRAELHDVLEACLTSRVEQRALFDQAFHVFWRDPHLLGEIIRMQPPAGGSSVVRHPAAAASARLMEALLDPSRTGQRHIGPLARSEPRIEPSWSDRERLRQMDFDSMTCGEALAAQRVIAAFEPLLARLYTRRQRASKAGARLELRQLLRDSGRRGGEAVELPRSIRRRRRESLCVIVDISGSMSRYSRMFLHFVHALMSGPRSADLRVSAFVFGTRLTHITRLLRRPDPDEALIHVARAVADWSGGTRIAFCLKEFNQRWARRLPLASSTLLLVTDGLELADIEMLTGEAQRLSRSCRRLLWLNPLLRYDAFVPKARGVRALLPHVDEMLPVHNIESLERLVSFLEQSSREYVPWT
jgi:uncharacterized protein with von Willebrand factor type A (vWA) domain